VNRRRKEETDSKTKAALKNKAQNTKETRNKNRATVTKRELTNRRKTFLRALAIGNKMEEAKMFIHTNTKK